jgi:acyl-CoA synthetase (AMP-forming)/AMP-acid ligase II
MESPDLLEVLYRHAVATPQREAFRFVADRGREVERLTFAGLYAAAESLAESLRGRVPAGAFVPLVFTPGLGFIVALFACWRLGATAVPLAPESFRRERGERYGLLERLAAPCVLCDDTTAALSGSAARIPWLNASARANGAPCTITPPVPAATHCALLQFTSGSTSAPRGVLVSHANLMANMRMIRDAFGHDRDSTVVAWTPLYHDQGLIGNVLQPLFLGSRCVLMSPATFVRDPLVWLEIISDQRAHTSGGPNFAYDLCVARWNEKRMADVDLGSWRVAFNGAEPVQADTVARFAERFARHGFDARSMFPCYGLAEATLLASGGPARRTPVTRRAATATRVGCGRAGTGSRLRIVDPATGRECAPGEIGEIRIAGPHVARGYWQDPAATDAHFVDGELRTGDLGFLDADGELFPTGRLKELIIQHGRNFVPEDIERTVAAASEALDPQRGVVFSADPGGDEQVVAVHEVRRTARRAAPLDDIVRTIRREVSARHGLTLHRVVLVPPCTIELTTSGKKRRGQVRADYLAGGLPTLA